MQIHPLRSATLVAALIAVAASAQAVVLAPGGAGLTPGTLFTVNGLLASTGPLAITGLNAQSEVKYTGTLYNNVYGLANGHLLFAYWFFNDATSANAVSRLSMTGFAGFSTNVDWITNSIPLAANSVYADRSVDGDTVGFQFEPVVIGGNGLIDPGSSNTAVAIEVDAPFFSLTGSTSTIDGGVATVKTYAPVPEPATLAMVACGLVGLVRRRNRR